MRARETTRRSTRPATVRLWPVFRSCTLFAVLAAMLAPCRPEVASATEQRDRAERFEVVVYGATPAGIAAAVSAGKSGRRVVLAGPTGRVGGLMTNGLSHTDFRTFEGLTGAYFDFSRRALAHYVRQYGEDSPQARACFRGTQAEPKVNLLLFEQWLAEHPNVAVRKLSLAEVRVEPRGGTERILSATFTDGEGNRLAIQGSVFIDATYEGDLMAAAGAEYRVGREARETYGESLAPQRADGQVQGYNFRLVMTRDPQLRVPPAAPAGYRREDYLDVIPLLGTQRLKTVFCDQTGGIYKAHLPALPNAKHDVNDVSRGLVRLSLPELSDDWPDADQPTRQRIFEQHLRHNVGLLHFLQADDAVPKRFRDEARQWGLCRDEFVETGHLPEQLYIREARRMVGQYVFTERDTDYAPNDARAVLRTDAIAMGDYGPNCHGTAHEGPLFGGRHTGEFYKPVAPYQIPYGVLVPRECANLLVPVACSASHVGFCALRLEPIWMSLGQAAGYAAHVAIATGLPVQEVPVAKVQRLLHAGGAATIYVSDVPPTSPEFAAVQWWGTQGGLHGLNPSPERPGQRGAHITSQYYEAYPGHAAEFDRPLDEALRQRWLAMADALGLASDRLSGQSSRGDFIRAAYRLAGSAGAED